MKARRTEAQAKEVRADDCRDKKGNETPVQIQKDCNRKNGLERKRLDSNSAAMTRNNPGPARR